MTTSIRRPSFSLACSSIAGVACMLLCNVAFGFPQDADAPKTPSKPEIIVGPVSVYSYSPPESFVRVNADDASLAQILTDLGPDAIEWYQHVQTLSNPWFEGRVPGSEGIEHAAQYIQFWMEQRGLTPAFENASDRGATAWRQKFELPGGQPKELTVALKFEGTEAAKGEVATLKCSASAEVTAPLAFCGYAIADGKDGYSSFAEGEDLAGRIAVVFRGEPLREDGKSAWGEDGRFTADSSLRQKIDALASRHAAGIMVVEPPNYAGKKSNLETLPVGQLGGARDMPCVVVDAAFAEPMLSAADSEHRSLATLRALADAGEIKTLYFAETAAATLSTSLDDGKLTTENIGGILLGKGALADEWIVIGAHYDHVGFGYYGADSNNRGVLHPGADDNASGTSGMLLLTKQLSEAYEAMGDDANVRSILFLAFSAEEVGLNGSRAFIKSPSIPADKVDFMLNLDMIGRLRSNDLEVGGVGSATGFLESLRPFFVASGLTIRADPSGRGPSDHANFYGAGIPVLFFFTGVHDSYHKPQDKGYTVTPQGAKKVIDLAGKIAMWRALETDRLVFESATNADGTTRGQDRGYAAVRLGVQPGMAEDGAIGVKVEGVSEGTSAADAGIKEGDLLLAWNGDELLSTAVMMEKLRACKVGDKVEIRLLRAGKEMTITVTMKAGKARGG
ncbi:MAG: M28 family peptidase [Phycisphaerales bacterium]|nr:M28 family peptidase [Phycisphaerales bacterium]